MHITLNLTIKILLINLMVKNARSPYNAREISWKHRAKMINLHNRDRIDQLNLNGKRDREEGNKKSLGCFLNS